MAKKQPMNASRVLATARAIISKKLPYVTRAVYALIPVESDAVPTLCVTEKGVMLYNPRFVEDKGIEFTPGLIYHEVSHLLRRHHERFKVVTGGDFVTSSGIQRHAENQRLWNLCTDAEINDDHPLPLPANCITPQSLGLPDGKTAEFYWARLRAQPAKDSDGEGANDAGDSEADSGSQESDGGSDEQNGGSGGSGGSGSDADASGDGGAPGGSQEPAQAAPGAGACGGCTGHRVAGEPLDGLHEGEVGRSDAELDRVRKQVAQAIQDEVAKGRGGSIGEGWQVWAGKELQPPVVPWDRTLARLTRRGAIYRSGSGSHNYARPSRRQGAFGYGSRAPVLARHVKPVPSILWVQDTSASMGRRDHRRGLSEAKEVLRKLNIPITFATCDTKIHTFIEARNLDDIVTNVVGGCGTDFRPIFQALDKMKKRPHVVIIATDGDGPAPARPPKGVEVIWLLIGNRTVTPAKWGHVIKVPHQQAA